MTPHGRPSPEAIARAARLIVAANLRIAREKAEAAIAEQQLQQAA